MEFLFPELDLDFFDHTSSIKNDYLPVITGVQFNYPRGTNERLLLDFALIIHYIEKAFIRQHKQQRTRKTER